MTSRAWLAAVALSAACVRTGTGRQETYRPAVGGDAARGKAVIAAYRCGACHTIPGVRGAYGKVAPPLTWFAERTFIAGELPNTPENLERWVRFPDQVEPKTAMPALGLSDEDARDVAAYLYTLK